MLRRIVLVLTVAAVMVAMIIATAVPAFAGAGGATNITDFKCGVVDSDLSTQDTTNSRSTVTPSGNINQSCHYHPPT